LKNMKVLLINPNSSLINKSWAYRKFCTPIAPMGLAYIASILEKDGVGVSIIDQFGNKMPDKELLGLIKRESPDLIGFSALTPVVPDIKRLIPGIRAVSKNSKIVLGNIHSTCFPDELLREGTADIVVRGEGEITMLELCRCLSQKKELSDLPGISFKIDGQIIHNPDRELIGDLDSLPFPAWHLFDLDNYTQHPMIGLNKTYAFPIIASRGCPYRCYYCSQDKVYGKVRRRGLGELIKEIEYFNDMLNIKFFGFCDAYFPFDEKSGLEFCDLMVKHKLHKKIKWCTETRVDKVTPALLRAMKEAGAHLIMYGIEVGNDAILRTLNKGTTLEQARIAVRETKKAGILSQGLFILGLPGETRETCIDTINFAKELDCDIVKFNIAMPYPGSRFFEDFYKSKQSYKQEAMTSWIDWTGAFEKMIYAPDGISRETLGYLQRKAMFDFYIRPKIIFKYFLKLKISYKNTIYGGIWLIFLLCSTLAKRLKSLLFKSHTS